MTEAQASAAASIATYVGEWVLDPSRSSVRLTHPTMWGLVKVKGGFSRLTGNGRVDEEGTISGNLAIEAASVNTGNKKRDKHLQSDDFLAVDRYPEIVFEAQSARTDGSSTRVSGTLTVRGTSRPIDVPVQVKESGPNALTLATTIDIDRHDYSIDWNQLGMMRGTATVAVEATFERTAGRA